MRFNAVQDAIPGADKLVAAGGAVASAFVALDYVDTALTVVIGASTVILVWIRIAIAVREWRQGKREAQ